MAEKTKVATRHEEAIQPARGGEVDAAAVRAQVERILSNALFSGSKRYTNLLSYVVEKSLNGQQDDLKERVIGIEVFGRTPDYDTSFDATVRVAAAEVRKRLTLYYSESGREHELRIEVPVGSYTAEFRLPEEKQLSKEIVQKAGRRKLKSWYVVATLVLVFLTLAGWGVRQLLFPESAIDKFWAPLIRSTGPVFICIDTPPINPSPLPSASNPNESVTSGNLQVSLEDISAADDLVTYLRRNGKESAVRPARDTSLSDLRSSPVVIFGLFDNEWVRKLEDDLRFRVLGDAGSREQWIEDSKNPIDKKWSVSMSPPLNGGGDIDYALISRVQDLSTGQWWIGITGLTGRGTKVAHQILIDPNAMASISTGFPKDWARKNLQLVLEVRKVQGGPGTFKLLNTYVW